MLVRARDKRCRPQPCELLSCSPFVQVASMRLQPAGQELSPPVLAVVAMLAWRSPLLLPSSRRRRRCVLVCVRDERCRPRPCELLSCSPRVEVATVALQPAVQELNPPVLAVVAMLATVAITAVVGTMGACVECATRRTAG